MYLSIPTSDGGYLLGGLTDSNNGDVQSGNHGGNDYWVVKIGGTVDINEFYDEEISLEGNELKSKIIEIPTLEYNIGLYNLII